MSKYIIGYIVSYAYLFSVILGVGFLQKKCCFSIEISRKIIHTLIVFTWNILYAFFWNNWQILLVPISFIVINAVSYKFKLFKMIERDNVEENHKGTIFFSIGITTLMLAALLFPKTIMQTGIATFALCFGDGLAAMIGIKAKHKVYIRPRKTLQGSIACLCGAFFGIFLFSEIMSYTVPLWIIFVLSVETALLELVGNGLDNFSIIYGTYLSACFLI